VSWALYAFRMRSSALMDKGLTARQNLALLRYARAVDLSLTWNLLCEIPGDRLEAAEQTLRLLPLIRHLHPPAGLARLIIDRLSPYFDHPERYGVSNVRAAYGAILPGSAAVSKGAYHFDGDHAVPRGLGLRTGVRLTWPGV
jgi:hypothetical protein